MARKSSKNTDNSMNAINEAINTPVDLEWGETADLLGLTIPQLQERMGAKLGDIVFSWELIPYEHKAMVDAVARDLEAERSVRSLNEAKPEITEQVEPPILEEKPEVQQKPKRQRRSSALTQKKTDAIQDNREAATQANKGITDALMLLQAQSGVRDAANAGTAYLTAFTATLTNVKGQGLQTIAAQTLQEIAAKSNFDPSELLKQLGIPVSAETLELLNASMAETLGKSAIATQEIMETSWGNGYDLSSELLALDSLLNLNS